MAGKPPLPTSQLKEHLKNCALAYDHGSVYTFVFDNEKAGENFHQFIVDSLGGRSLKADEELLTITAKDKTFYQVVAKSGNWKNAPDQTKSFITEVSQWALSNPSRWLQGTPNEGPTEADVTQKLSQKLQIS